MAIDSKYGRVDFQYGNIGEDEPVFVLRGRDANVPTLLSVYALLCDNAGSPKHHLEGVVATRREIEEWQANNFTQVPQSAERDPSRT